MSFDVEISFAGLMVALLDYQDSTTKTGLNKVVVRPTAEHPTHQIHIPRLSFFMADLKTTNLIGFKNLVLSADGQAIASLDIENDLRRKAIKIDTTGGPANFSALWLPAAPRPTNAAEEKALNWLPDLHGDLKLIHADFNSPASLQFHDIELPPGNLESRDILLDPSAGFPHALWGFSDAGATHSTKELAERLVWTATVTSLKITTDFFSLEVDDEFAKLRGKTKVQICFGNMPGGARALRTGEPDHLRHHRMTLAPNDPEVGISRLGGGPISAGAACPPAILVRP